MEQPAYVSPTGSRAITCLDDLATWDSRALGHAMLDDMCDHLASRATRPVWTPPPAASRALFQAPLPWAPTSLEDCYAQFVEHVLPYDSGNAHPGFMGWAQGGGTVVGMLADLLASGMNANLGGRDHMPIAVELQVADWMRQTFGYPEGASGLFTTGASQANFLAVLIARAQALGAETRDMGLGPRGMRLRAYASAGVHGCLPRALDMAGLGARALRLIPQGPDHRIDLNALRLEIARDRAAGDIPFLVVGSAGTVDVGALDDLAGLADIARAESLWFHVDGALGALAVLSPELAPSLRGLERSDSLAFDFHKWGQVPYDAGFLLVRDGALHKATFASKEAYLTRAEQGLAGGDWWPCDYGMDLSRSFRALKVWFTLKTYGLTALGQAIKRTCDLAQELGERIRTDPDLHLAAPVSLNVVCFEHRTGRHNERIVSDLQLRGRVAPSLTRLSGRPVIRAAILNHRTRLCDIEALLSEVRDAGDRAEAEPPTAAYSTSVAATAE